MMHDVKIFFYLYDILNTCCTFFIFPSIQNKKPHKSVFMLAAWTMQNIYELFHLLFSAHFVRYSSFLTLHCRTIWISRSFNPLLNFTAPVKSFNFSTSFRNYSKSFRINPPQLSNILSKVEFKWPPPKYMWCEIIQMNYREWSILNQNYAPKVWFSASLDIENLQNPIQWKRFSEPKIQKSQNKCWSYAFPTYVTKHCS